MSNHWQHNNSPLEDDHIEYADTFSQSFLSPMSTTLQDMEDMEYQPQGKKKLIHALPMFEDSPSDYSLASLGDTSAYDDFSSSPHTATSAGSASTFVGPMEIHHHHPQQRHSMLAGGTKQYNLFMNERSKLQQVNSQHHHHHNHQQQHHQQHQQYQYLPTGQFINPGYPAATSSSSLASHHPGSAAHGFPMSAPANIGYEFHLSARSSLGSPPSSNTNTMNLSPQQQHSTDLPQNMEDDYAMQLNLQAMMEKKRRRRESHNAVERRRRENINDRIHELGCLLPESMLEEITNTGNNGSQSPSSGNGNSTSGSSKPNKGAILRKSVDHIRLLKQEVSVYRQRVQELESILEQYNVIKKEENV